MGCAATRIFFWLTVGLLALPAPVSAVTGDFERNEALCRDWNAITDQRIDACGWLIDSVGQTETVSSDIYFNRGSAWLNKDEYRRALADFETVLTLSPRDSDAYVGRGIAWRELGEYEHAHKALGSALELDPNNSRSYSHRGVTFHFEGELDLALQDFDKAIRLDPEDAFAYNWRGLTYWYKKALRLAIIDLDRAIELSPYYYWPHFNRGLVNYDRQEFQRMVWDFDEVIRIEPEDPDGFFYRGVAHIELENWAHAIEDFSESIRLHPSYAEAYRRRAAVYRVLEKFDLAIQDYQTSDRFIGTVEDFSAHDPYLAYVFRLRGEERFEARDYRGAIADYDMAIRLAPLEREHYPLLEMALEKAINVIVRSSDDFVLKGRAYAQQKNYKRAVQEFEMALRHDPDNVMAHFHLSRAYARRGEYKRASNLWQVLGGKSYYRGHAYIESGELEKAERIFTALVFLFPTDSYIYDGLGTLFFALGERGKGVVAYEKAVRVSPEDPWFQAQLGRAYYYQGEFEAAADALNTAVVADTEDLYNHLWLHLARLRSLRESELVQSADKLDLAEWPGPVIQFFLGQMDENQFLSTATLEPEAARRKEKQCEAEFFLGTWHLHKDRKQEAEGRFRTAREICPRDFIEYQGAIMELSALGEK